MEMTAIPYAEALADVQARVVRSHTSFQAGMSVLPKARREAMYALYAFCREVDDIADDSPTPDEAARGLALWRERISNAFREKASDSITTALVPAIAEFKLVEEDFQSIIDGMAMDAAVIRAPDEATFDLYCDRVASAVGRVSVRIFGDSGARAMEVAHHLGRALQITNVLRDLAEDSARGRLYLPSELLTKHGIALQSPAEIVHDPRLPQACRDLACRARDHFFAADRVMALCKPSSMRPARVMRAYYGAILDRLMASGWRAPFARVGLPAWQKIWLALRHGAF
jgi:squalene synthase HpnD